MNCELDFETVKAKELQKKNDNLLAGVNVNKEADLKDREKLIAEYERRTHELETRMKEKSLARDESVNTKILNSTIDRLK